MDDVRVENLYDEYEVLQSRIQSHYSKMPKRLKVVAAYIVMHPEEIALSTLVELAAATGTSPSTFVRLSKYFGYAGFSDMQVIYRDNLRDVLNGYKGRLNAVQPRQDDTLLGPVIEAASLSLERMRETINSENWQHIVEQLGRADMIWLAAVGRNAIIMDYVYYMMTNTGILCRKFSADPQIAERELKMFGDGDQMLAISFTPYSDGVISIVNLAQEKKLPYSIITDTRVSPIYKEGALLVQESDCAGIRTMSAGMTIMQALVMEIGARRGA